MKSLDKKPEDFIKLLQFSLNKEGINKDIYYIGELGDEKRLNDNLCLLRSDEQWIILYTERGNVSDYSSHSSLRVAIKDFYGRLVRSPSPWDYREEWEKETGKEFFDNNMNIPELKIDLMEGRFDLDGISIHKLFREALREGKAIEEDVLFCSSDIKLLISYDSGQFEVSLMPDDDLDFWDADKLAGKICSEVSKLAGKKSYRSKILFSWGEVLLLSEWRDGGWGAFFKLYH